jgi:hypothetical protein
LLRIWLWLCDDDDDDDDDDDESGFVLLNPKNLRKFGAR